VRADGEGVQPLATTLKFTGGTLHMVIFDVADDLYIDLEQHLAAAYPRD
jgi:hypothetical protein